MLDNNNEKKTFDSSETAMESRKNEPSKKILCNV